MFAGSTCPLASNRTTTQICIKPLDLLTPFVSHRSALLHPQPLCFDILPQNTRGGGSHNSNQFVRRNSAAPWPTLAATYTRYDFSVANMPIDASSINSVAAQPTTCK